MLARLGNLIYWLGCAAAALSVGGAGLFLMQTSENPADRFLPLFFAFTALALWLTGRAARYVLAGR